MKQTDPQLKLRLPPELMAKIRSASEVARRPISSEVVDRLEKAYAPKSANWAKALKSLPVPDYDNRIVALEARVSELSDLCVKLVNRVEDCMGGSKGKAK